MNVKYKKISVGYTLTWTTDSFLSSLKVFFIQLQKCEKPLPKKKKIVKENYTIPESTVLILQKYSQKRGMSLYHIGNDN